MEESSRANRGLFLTRRYRHSIMIPHARGRMEGPQRSTNWREAHKKAAAPALTPLMRGWGHDGGRIVAGWGERFYGVNTLCRRPVESGPCPSRKPTIEAQPGSVV
jgi:hypothetical protein